MKFTERVLKLPVEIYNRKQSEIMGNDDENGVPSFLKVLPMEIQSYHPHLNKDGEFEKNKIMMYCKGDPSCIKVLLSVEAFEKAVNDFMAKD